MKIMKNYENEIIKILDIKCDKNGSVSYCVICPWPFDCGLLAAIHFQPQTHDQPAKTLIYLKETSGAVSELKLWETELKLLRTKCYLQPAEKETDQTLTKFL